MDSSPCGETSSNQACDTSDNGAISLCSDDTLIPWNQVFLCFGSDLSPPVFLVYVCFLVAVTLIVMWIGVNLLSKNAEMYFAPALEDLCIKWHVPKRTAAALFVALANGAPDLASTGYMFRQGQGDMAFGALLGASTYVCMNVIGMVISLQPKEPMKANPALIRDIGSLLVIVFILFPIFISGLSRGWVLVLIGTYAALTVAIFLGDEWHRRGRPPLLTTFLSPAPSGVFQPLVQSETPDSSNSNHPLNFESWPRPPIPASFSTYINETSMRMQVMRETRLRTNHQALLDPDYTLSVPPAHNRPTPLTAIRLDSSSGATPRQTDAVESWNQMAPSMATPNSHHEAPVIATDVQISLGKQLKTVQTTGITHHVQPVDTESVVLPQESPSSAVSGEASVSTSHLIYPSDSISQQRSLPPHEHIHQSHTDMNRLDIEVDVPGVDPSAWARNDTLRLLGMLFPPCNPPSDEPTLRNAEVDHSGEEYAEVTHHSTSCMPTAACITQKLDIPDYVTYCSIGWHDRDSAHGLGLTLMLVPMALMRFTIPTVSADFYDPFIFVVSSALSPFTAAWLYGIEGYWVACILASITASGIAASIVVAGVRCHALILPHIAAFHTSTRELINPGR